MIPQQFYYMRGLPNNNNIKEFAGVVKALPILWCRAGEYRLVPKEVVQNAIESIASHAKMPTKNSLRWGGACIYWDQGIPITNQAGRILTGGE